MKAYKGFDENLCCNAKQYKPRKTYRCLYKPDLCTRGFHACTKPLDVFQYYPPGPDNRYAIVDLKPNKQTSDDSKRVGNKIKILEEIDAKQLIEEQLCNSSINNEIINNTDFKCSILPPKSAINVLDEKSIIGDRCTGIIGDNNNRIITNSRSAVYAKDFNMIVMGINSKCVADFGSIAVGDSHCSIETGAYGVSVSKEIAITGEHGLAVVFGPNPKVKGGIGASLVAVEVNYFDRYNDFAFGIVDGECIKPNVWYTVKNNKLVKYTEDEMEEDNE